MSLDKLFEWAIVITLGFMVTGNLDKFTHWVYRAQAKVIYESRASNWGSPSIFNINSTR